MKELITDPLILIPLLFVFVIYFLITFHYGSKQKIAAKLEYLLAFVFLFVSPGLAISPINILQPYHFTVPKISLRSIVIKFGLYSYFIIILKSSFSRIFQSSLLLFSNPFLGLLLCLSLLSAIWSETPAYTLRQSLLIVGLSIFSAHIASRYSWDKLVVLIRYSTTLISILSAFYALAMPSIGVEPKGWKGITSHPNRLGILLSLNITLWLFHAIHHPKQRWFAVSFAFFSLYVRQNTNSATSLVLILILLTLVGCLRLLKSLSFQQAFVGVVIFMVLGIGIMLIVLENWFNILNALDKDPSLTGRTEFWPQIIERIVEKRPILGYGTQGFWQAWRGIENPANGISTPKGFKPPHAHNGFLEIFLDLGVVGFVIFLFAFFRTVASAVFYMGINPSSESLLPLVFLTWMVIPNITVSELFYPTHIWVYFVIITVRLNLEIKQFNQRQKQIKYQLAYP
ncbi:MAG: O-antigen ligase family protein [Microcoleaceae cyanobacterium]